MVLGFKLNPLNTGLQTPSGRVPSNTFRASLAESSRSIASSRRRKVLACYKLPDRLWVVEVLLGELVVRRCLLEDVFQDAIFCKDCQLMCEWEILGRIWEECRGKLAGTSILKRTSPACAQSKNLGCVGRVPWQIGFTYLDQYTAAHF